MGQLKKQVLGTNSGSIGDVVFKKNGDGTFTSSKPDSYRVSDSETALLVRQKFRLAVKIASSINSIPELKTLWPHDAAKRLSRFSEMVKMNFGLIKGPDMTGSPTLSYSLGFSLKNTEVFVSNTNVALTGDPIGNAVGIDDHVEKFIIAKGLIVLTDPLEARAGKAIEVIKIQSGKQTLDLAAEININILLDDKISQLVGMYNVKKAYLTILTTDQPGNVVNYSNTYGN